MAISNSVDQPNEPLIFRFRTYGTPGFNHLGVHSPRSLAHSTSAGRVRTPAFL